MASMTFTFPALPKSAAELKALPEAALTSPFAVAALTVAALCCYEENKDACIEMLNFLKGPQPLSAYDLQFLRDRLTGKGYKPFSFFEGSSPANGYKPSVPYTITVSDNPYSYGDANYATLWIKSSGADSARQVKLRKKASAGQWFLWDQMLLSDIRNPAEEDPWA